MDTLTPVVHTPDTAISVDVHRKVGDYTFAVSVHSDGHPLTRADGNDMPFRPRYSMSPWKVVEDFVVRFGNGKPVTLTYRDEVPHGS